MNQEANTIAVKKSDVKLKSAQVALRSAEVQEILSAVPNWMIRWGSCLILSVFIMLLYLSWLIKYPEVIKGEAMLTTANPPIKIYSKSTGYLNRIFISNDSLIAKGQLIAQIDNPLRKSTLDSLSSLLFNFDYLQYQELLDFLKEKSPLGQSQTAANDLYLQLHEYSELLTNDFHNEQLDNLENKIIYNERLAWISKQEMDLHKIELLQAKEKFYADSILFVKKVTPKHAFYKNRSELIVAKQKLFSTKKNYVQYMMISNDLIAQRNEIENNLKLKKSRLESEIKTTINSVNNYLHSWHENYLIQAPISGTLSYLDNITEKELVSSNSPLFAIIPDKNNVIAVVRIQGGGFGKIEANQVVRLKLENYPAHEYGQVLGKIKNFSQLAGKEGYIVKVELMDGLNTTYHKSLKYTPEMKGTAEIVTADLRFIERIFYSFRKLFERK